MMTNPTLDMIRDFMTEAHQRGYVPDTIIMSPKMGQAMWEGTNHHVSNTVYGMRIIVDRKCPDDKFYVLRSDDTQGVKL